jgi:hypothetical protein
MYIRSTAVLFTLALLGCHGSDYKPPATSANGQTPPAYPGEVTSTSGGRMGDHIPSRNPATAIPNPNPAPPHNMPASAPPPSAGTSTPTQNSPYKPGADQPPATGGGPKTESGGAVYGDGNEGNTGAIKGGEPPK